MLSFSKRIIRPHIAGRVSRLVGSGVVAVNINLLSVSKCAAFSTTVINRIDPNTKRNNLIVFDIDETLCFSIHDNDKETKLAKVEYSHRNPECQIVQFLYPTYASWYVFRPHFSALLNYLMEKDARIAFFSAGTEDRNIPLIQQLLTRTMGKEAYESAVKEGQFAIYSRHHMRRAIVGKEDGVKVYDEGNRVKDLTPIIEHYNTHHNKGALETLDDAILIDDNPMYCAHNQLTTIYTPGSHIELTSEMKHVRHLRLKNNFYYFLGLFKTHFESATYQYLPLRLNLGEILQLDPRFDSKHCIPFLDFEIDMTLLGLEEVRKTCPEAVFYGLETYVQEDSTGLAVPSLAPFYHSAEVTERLLDDIISGKRKLSEPTIYMFIVQLAEDGLAFHVRNHADQKPPVAAGTEEVVEMSPIEHKFHTVCDMINGTTPEDKKKAVPSE